MSILNDKKSVNEPKIGMIFPGQGSQYLGMGKEFYDTERIVQEAFEDASNALKENFVQLCFASSEKMLQGTILTQTGIFLVSASIYKLLSEEHGINPDLVAGHSLGEYTAVFAAGGLNFFDSLYLLNKRGQFMQAAMDNQDGCMLAVMNLDEERLRFICGQHDVPDTLDHVAELAIFNSPTQMVVSGTCNELKKVSEDASTQGAVTTILPVSGAFHSRLLSQAESLYSAYLLKADFSDLKIPLINNVMAKRVTSAESVKLSLVKQTSSHLYWWHSMKYFEDMDLIIEVGPNKIFTKMLKREWPEKNIISVNNHDDIEEVKTFIKSFKV